MQIKIADIIARFELLTSNSIARSGEIFKVSSRRNFGFETSNFSKLNRNDFDDFGCCCVDRFSSANPELVDASQLPVGVSSPLENRRFE
jgi:hypothetical protein